MTIHDIQQGTPEWLELRAYRFGGTDAKLFVTDPKKDGVIAAGLRNALPGKLANKFLPDPFADNFTSGAMDHGTEWEPIAREHYEETRFCQVDEVGYCSVGPWFGYSPDGFVGEDGLIEIKCPQPKEFMRYFITGNVMKPEHYAQCQWGLFITKRKWCDFIYYHPEGGILVNRQFPDEKYQDKFLFRSSYVAVELHRMAKEWKEREILITN